MRKITKILLSFLGGVEVTFYIFTPVLLAAVWVAVGGLDDWTEYFFYGIGLLSTIFRSIKVGWLNNGRTNYSE